MLTINELRDQFDLQGEIMVESFNEVGEDEQVHYSGEAELLPANSPFANAEIKFMYASQRVHYREMSGRHSARLAAAAPVHIPLMVIEIERSIDDE